jgi:hypothetical protein
MEIQRFWILRSFSWAGFFFFLNRYLAVLGHIPVIMLSFWNSGDLAHKFKICHRLYSYHQYLEMGIQVVVGVLLIMRVYALYDQNRWVVVFFITFATIDVGIACWAVVSKDPIKLPPQDFAVSAPGCAEPISDKQGARLAVAWSGQLAFDAIVFCLTLYKSLLIVRTSRRPLISTLLRDGVLYFAILTIANLANILTFLLAVSLSKGLTSTFVNIISATMISRLMLNLRDPKILMSSTNRTTTMENSTTTSTRLYPMMSTIVDPNPFTIPYTEDEHVDARGEVTRPIEDIESIPLNPNLDSKA